MMIRSNKCVFVKVCNNHMKFFIRHAQNICHDLKELGTNNVLNFCNTTFHYLIIAEISFKVILQTVNHYLILWLLYNI